MCGLAGWIDHTPNQQRDSNQIINDMIAPLKPRGPDDQGSWHNTNTHLGHTRLKIIDLHSGQQPMVSDKSVLVFNGEIYNYKELHHELSRQYSFHTSSDTEVLQKTLEQWGTDALKKIKGMFAFAYYDLKNKSLLLARDPVGQKPLFYCHHSGGLIFSSTTTSLKQHPDVLTNISFPSLGHYLVGEAPRDPQTLYQHIHAVPSGHYLIYKNNQFQLIEYWDWPQGRTSISLQEQQDQFSSLFEVAVKRRLQADVPLGLFLSGGLDSSSVAWQASQLREPTSIQTFSIGFEEKSYDESFYSDLIAKHFNTQHHHEVLTEKNLIDILPDALDSCDQPLADSSLLPFYLLCQMTKQHVTVALSGDGADDLMAGYDPFKALSYLNLLNTLPTTLISWLQNQMESWSPSNVNLPWSFKAKQFLRAHRLRAPHAVSQWMSAYDEKLLALVLPAQKNYSLHLSPSGNNSIDASISYFRSRYLRDQILTKVDRASMAHSLEVRSPFLDINLAEFLSQLPTSRLFHSNQGKWPLRLWAKNKIPDQCITRVKKGFGMPIAQWLKGPLADWLIDTVNEKSLSDLGLNPSHIIKMRDTHLNGREDHRKELWTIAVLTHWHSRQ